MKSSPLTPNLPPSPPLPASEPSNSTVRSIPPIISIRDLVKQFGRFAALRGVTATFESGKLYAILGDNGAGKTTLLRTLAGLNRPTRGELRVLGAADHREVCHQIGYMAH